MYTGIIWDFDGTLFNTYPGMVKAFKKALIDLGVEEKSEAILMQMKISVGHATKYFEEMYNLNGEKLTALYKAYENDSREEDMPPFPDAEAFCKIFKESGGSNYLLTHRGESTHKLLKYYNMIQYFEEIVTSSSGFKKPNPEGFLYFAAKYKTKKEEFLVIGDRDIEILGAKNAGMDACLFSSGGFEYDLDARYKIKSLKELYQIFNF